MDASEQVLTGLQSPDWREQLKAIKILIDLKDPQFIPTLVTALVRLVDIADGMTDTEAITEASEQAICAMNETARAPLEKIRDDATQGSLTYDVADYLLSQLDEWQWLIKHNPGMQ